MGKNNWKNIWMNRKVDALSKEDDYQKIFVELKKSNGFDVIGDGLTPTALIQQYEDTKEKLSYDGINKDNREISSVYEVGCGSGANLYMFERAGMKCGGIDYSENLIAGAKNILNTEDLLCNEAIQMPVEPKYDSVLSNSVFSYFTDEDYARIVLEKMYQKAKKSIGLLDIHDVTKEKAYLEYRVKNVEDYEKRYQDLPKLFYSKSFFEQFAAEKHMDIIFCDSKVEGYWNNDFVFNCYMYKR